MSSASVFGYVPRWSVEVLRFAAMFAIALTVATVYTARGDNHDSTFWACLYAGSLTQVGTTEPANCGRGEKVSWNAQGIPGEPGQPGAPALSGLTTVESNVYHDSSIPSIGSRLLVCPDGLVPVGSGYTLAESTIGQGIIVEDRAYAGDEDNPYNFPFDAALYPGEYGWWFSWHITTPGLIRWTFNLYCADVPPPAAT